jgi:low affinity Fe/Cu permease
MPESSQTGYSSNWFSRFAKAVAYYAGHPAVFGVALGVIILWAILGPIFGFSDTWQLVINTATTIVTFLMVFLIQNTQNRDSQALQIKLDELIRATKGAHIALLDLENLSDKEIDSVQHQYGELAEKARREMRKGISDTGTPDIQHTAERSRNAATRTPGERR